MKVAFLGIGAMGERIARRVLADGHHVTVWNRTEGRVRSLLEKGAAQADCVAEAAEAGEVVFSCVRDDQASREVWKQVDRMEGIGVELSTISPQRAREWSETAKFPTLEAPMIGTRPHAEAGNLVLLIGGKELIRPDVEKLFSSFAGKQIWLGNDPGRAAVLKLLVNGLLATQAVTWAELLAIARDTGLEEKTIVEILKDMPVTSPAAAFLAGQMVQKDFEPMFPIELVEKDLSYLHSLRPAGRVVGATLKTFKKCLDLGLGSRNISGVSGYV